MEFSQTNELCEVKLPTSAPENAEHKTSLSSETCSFYSTIFHSILYYLLHSSILKKTGKKGSHGVRHPGVNVRVG